MCVLSPKMLRGIFVAQMAEVISINKIKHALLPLSQHQVLAGY